MSYSWRSSNEMDNDAFPYIYSRVVAAYCASLHPTGLTRLGWKRSISGRAAWRGFPSKSSLWNTEIETRHEIPRQLVPTIWH